MTAIPDGDLTFAVRIEGYGDQFGRFYFCTKKPVSTFAGLRDRWLPTLWKNPNSKSTDHALDQFSESGNFQTGHHTLPDWTCRLMATDQLFELFHAHLFPVAIDTLGAPLIQGSTTVVFASGTPATVAAGDMIYIAREAIRLGTEDPPASGIFINCFRGALATQDVGHAELFKRTPQDNRIYDRQVAPTARKLDLGFLTELAANNPTGFTDSSFRVIYSFALQDIGSVDGGISVSLRCSGLGAIAQDTTLYDKRWRGVVIQAPLVIEVEGESVILRNPVVMQKVPRGSAESFGPRSMPSSPTSVNYAWCRYKDTAVILAPLLSEFAEDNTYEIRTEFRLPFSRKVDVDEPKVGDELWEIVSSVPESPSSAGPWPAVQTFNQLPLGRSRNSAFGDIVTILLQLLTSTERGENGKYDIGISFNIEMPVNYLDLTGMEALRASMGARMQYASLYVGSEEDPPNAKEWIEKHLLAPFRLVFTVGSDGLWTLKNIDDIPPVRVTVPTVTDSDLLTDTKSGTKISYSTGLSHMRDGVLFKYQMSPSGETKLLEFINETAQEFRLNSAGPLAVEAIGIRDDNQAAAIGQSLQWSWRQARPPFEFSQLLRDRLLTGDIFRITTAQLADVNQETGKPTRGVTNSLCYVQGAIVHLEGPVGRADLKALHWGIGVGNVGYIGISLEVVSGFVYSVGTGVIEFEENRYQSPIDDGYLWDADVEPVEANWQLRHMDEFGAPITTSVLVASVSVGTNEITFSPYPGAWDVGSPPEAGDIFYSAAWSNLTEDDQKRFIHQAKTDGTLGPAGDPGFKWVI